MITISRNLKLFVGLFFFGFWIQDAYAYIDPSAGSMFVQAILGVLVGLGVAIKIYWEKIKSKFRRY